MLVIHVKNGKLYEVAFTALHTETLEVLTIYRDKLGTFWARPTKMFNDGRFRPLGAEILMADEETSTAPQTPEVQPIPAVLPEHRHRAYGCQSVDVEAGQVTYRNLQTGKIGIMNTTKEIAQKISDWYTRKDKRMIQDAIPELSAIQREMMLSGLNEEEQVAFYKQSGD